MARLTSTPVLIGLMVAALVGAAVLALQVTADLRVPVPAAAPHLPAPRPARRAATAQPTSGAPRRHRTGPVPVLLPGAPMTMHHVMKPLAAAGAHQSSPVVYTALGASDAVGVGADDPATQSWVADLGRMLPAGSTVHNLGVSGILLGAALRQELPAAIASRPNLVTIWLAVNDINAQVPLSLYNTQLDTLLKTLRKRTHAALFVGNVPALGLLPRYQVVAGPALNALVARWNRAIAAVAARYGATLVDLHTPSLTTLARHPDYVSADGFHPSTLGYRDEAMTFWQAILKHQGLLPLR